jgi:hypothetical protein
LQKQKIKQTWLSTLFVGVFFWGIKRILAPVPLAGTLVDIVESAI